MLVVVTVTILIIISVGIFMVYRPIPTTESEKPGPIPKKVSQVQDCKGKWGPWSECSSSCGMHGADNSNRLGTQKREWIVTTPANNGGKACVYDIEKDGYRSCKGAKGYWGPWSQFSPATAKNGCVRSRTRKMIITDLGDMPSNYVCPREIEKRHCPMTRSYPPRCIQCG